MSILASVGDLLTLLAAGAALIAATRALQVASRLARGQAATVRPPTVQAEPTNPAPPATSSAASKPPANGSSTRGNGLREQLRAFLADRSDLELSLVQIANGVGRSSATVSYALDKLVAAGDVELTSPKPRRYRITSAGASAIPQTTASAAAPTPTPVTEQAEQSSGISAGEPRRKPKPASTPRSTSGAKARGGLRDEVRAVLAGRPSETLSLAEISNAVGRATATVSYQLDRLMRSGDVIKAGDKPRRYAIAASAQPQPSASTGTPEKKAIVAAAVKPSSPQGRRGSRRATAEPTQPKPARPATSGARRRKKTADAATSDAAASAK
ncbi:MAG TPA: hypothetical protein VFA45_01440 [Actinomycetes bacterium]|jgi:predicted ArsR family transcriptional regulator|nr:hypothetical protein [Actinomycetes bacterium]